MRAVKLRITRALILNENGHVAGSPPMLMVSAYKKVFNRSIFMLEVFHLKAGAVKSRMSVNK